MTIDSGVDGSGIEGFVSLDIDYAIIEHFSSNLYPSPNKAVEELVTNGFDAMANETAVYVPGQFTADEVIVWDDGESMGVEDIKNLWMIAKSPKVGQRIISGPKAIARKVIGKFGIGKLASYTIGETIAHLCHRDEGYLLVEVDFDIVRNDLTIDTLNSGTSNIVTAAIADVQIEDLSTGGSRKTFKTPIRRLSEQEARKWARSRFTNIPSNFDNWFSRSSWTMAVVSRMKRDDLLPGRLRWVLGLSMPLRPDFHVFVDDEPVVSKLESAGIVQKWTFGSNDIQSALLRDWQDAVDKGELRGEIIFGTAKGLDPRLDVNEETPYVDLPSLGRIWGVARLYGMSLQRREEYGRSHGFFIFVRDRLVNPEDDKLFLIDPSFGTFFRSQFILNIDGLDADLLASREEIRRDTPNARELRLLQTAIYRTVRNRQDAITDASAEHASSAQRLPLYSRGHFIEPIMALLAKREAKMGSAPGSRQLSLDLTKPEVKREALGEEAPMSELSIDGSGFTVNDRHPYFVTVRNRAGGRYADEVMREYDVLAVSERLFEGYLYDIGVDDDKVSAIIEWRDGMYRTLARASRSSIEQLARELREASYKGSALFENQLVRVLEAMGFQAERDGARGRKDVKMLAPAGEESYIFTFEAKGRQQDDGLPNDDAEISNANAHRIATSAEHAVVVARKFAGFDRPTKEMPTILQECHAQQDIETQQKGVVSIMEIDSLIELLKIMSKYYYPLNYVRKIFTTIESPQEKLNRVKGFDKPLDGFDYRLLLDRIWEEQISLGIGTKIPLRFIWLKYYRDSMPTEDAFSTSFLPKVNALYIMANPYIVYQPNTADIALIQAPDNIVQRIKAVLRQEEAAEALVSGMTQR